MSVECPLKIVTINDLSLKQAMIIVDKKEKQLFCFDSRGQLGNDPMIDFLLTRII